MDKTSYRVLTLTVSCMLFLSTTAQQVIAWPCPPPRPDCHTCTETGWEYNCTAGEICCDGDCCISSECCSGAGCCGGTCCSGGETCCGGECCDPDDCCNNVCCSAGEECCGGECCDPDDCCNGEICCNSGDNCCTDSGSYCCGSDETCCQGDCCATGQCCDDDECVDDCPTGECCDDGTCVDDCPSGECCDDGTCVSSCPSGECCDDGECVDTCPNCYECVDGDCVPCKCWDADTAISGSITVENAKLCEQVTHAPLILDTDHWFLGGDGHGYPSDSLTYSWTASAGTPGTSTTPNFTWTAPPCIGPVTITLMADDFPDSMDNPCPDSTRDDGPGNFDDVSTVSLPTNCVTGTKSVSLNSHDEGAPSCPSSKCGNTQFNYPWGITAPNGSVVLGARYNECKWTFQVTANGRTDTSACPSNYINVVQGSESGITETNYCSIVDNFKNGDGCVQIGTGGPRFSNTPCVEIHEAKHLEYFTDKLADQVSWLLGRSSMDDMTIDCGNSDTTTCGAAAAARAPSVKPDVLMAYNNAVDYVAAQGDAGPVLAAKSCFTIIAGKICAHAASQGWTSCTHCP